MFIFALFTLVLSLNESLIIQSPQGLANNTELQQIPFIIADFSYVPYGQSITGVLEVANPYHFCNSKFNHSVDRSSDQSNVKILLLRRGGCTFGEKTIQAQLLGYQIVLMQDNVDENINKLGIPRDHLQ
ncbi:unnamed protein product (macronuclear) [Paramecium tetraurelia]|uniref:PA domain-containing protein n=1 Tax=Paramecium tetraurelia TaxID=5888 RepID=A0CFL2_PARTE|nr:uncharacterized protein GSPATT00038019001 [Paramecium tetraurelia]CAK69579.1 unnamed protein product [Paramecium tetraurelia]|eukprot:XP_001436976.1 hypothetical protein (macronuclear) [Paramecium tetraurelia strain d4-2]